jgi:hypothetical protein
MRVAIITTDNIIVIDGVPHRTDCADLVAQQISAVQWYETEGEVEYIGHAKPNEKITDFTAFQTYVDNATELNPEPFNPALDSFEPKTMEDILVKGV